MLSEEDQGHGTGQRHPEYVQYHLQWEAQQRALRDRIVDTDAEAWDLTDDPSPGSTPLRRVGGVDVSFVKDDPDTACAALVVLEFPSLRLLYEDYAIVKLDLPYISGFLAFRECPHLTAMVETLRRDRPELLPQIVLVDGMGVLHPRGLGLASHLGVVTGLPTIGVGKTFLNVDGLQRDKVLRESHERLGGSGDTWRLVGASGRELGAALRSTAGAPNPVFVSRGHLITLETALRVVRACCKYRVPEPIRLADKGSREYLRFHIPQRPPLTTGEEVRAPDPPAFADILAASHPCELLV